MGGKSDLALKALRNDFKVLFGRLAKCRRTVAALKEESAAAKTKVDGKLSAQRKEQEDKALFDKYDKDLDGKLDQFDIASFAKDEYTFEPPEDVLEKIIGAIGADGGVPYDNFRRLKAMLAIKKSEAKKAKAAAGEAVV